MRKSPRAAVAAAALVSSLVLAPTALADPDAAPSTEGGQPHLSSDQPLVPIPAPEGSIIDTSVIPFNSEAQWQPVPVWDWSSPWMTGVEVCSPEGVPPAPSDEVPWAPTSDVQHVVLSPGDGGNPQGWTATVSFAPYASLNDSVGALHSYKVYVEHCPLVNPDAKVQNGGAIARNDPSSAHGVVVTHGHYMELFAVALGSGVVELAMTHPTDTGQVAFEYSPSQVIAGLRGALVRPQSEPGPFGMPFGH